jgi:undecaprenyl-diphosphatase
VTRGEPITQLDARIAQWFQAHATGGVTRAMAGVSWFHTWPIGVIGVGFLLHLLARREWLWAIFGLCAVLGGIGLNTLLKLVFHRARPTLSGLSYALQTYSFPSGHTLAATVLYGVFAAYTIRSFDSHRAKIGIAIAATAIVVLVAFSRLYLGVHYLSDVLAAFAEGIAWLALCYAAVHTLAGRPRPPR